MDQTTVVNQPSNKTTEYQCFIKAMVKGEPTFTLRAQDLSAPELVDLWAAINAKHLGQDHPKVTQAQEIAERMRQWPNRKKAD